MLVVIGKDLINPDQIVSMKESRLPEDMGNKKRIVISTSNGRHFIYDAGEDGYASARALRDIMLKNYVESLIPERRS